ncbi:MAG TPA: hypothetical protein VL325_06050 [Pyrinomonadaceae bacterium]|jgi:hypothetical protein|nr:hypothetical protein [Pyrinomonadaceae bacterium]
MSIPLRPEDKAQIESMLATLKPQIFIMDGGITNTAASGNIPVIAPPPGGVILLPTGFVTALTNTLRAQRDYCEKLTNLVELMYQKMNE